MATIVSGWMGLRQNIVAMSQGYKLPTFKNNNNNSNNNNNNNGHNSKWVDGIEAKHCCHVSGI